MIGILRDLERLLLPNCCIVCERLISARTPDALVCEVCSARMRPLESGGACTRCMQPLPPEGPCRFCADWPDELRTVKSAVWLDSEASAVVRSLKYEGRPRLAGEVAAVMDRHLEAGLGVLVPVPTTHARRRDRGYDQAEMIARALAARWGLALRTDLLLRTGAVGSQTALTPDERRANVAGAYCAASPPAPRSAARLILVDDVLTTGATLSAAARAVVAAGWTEVIGVTFARAQPYERAVFGTRLANQLRF